jgi:hypothetical protein
MAELKSCVHSMESAVVFRLKQSLEFKPISVSRKSPGCRKAILTMHVLGVALSLQWNLMS